MWSCKRCEIPVHADESQHRLRVRDCADAFSILRLRFDRGILSTAAAVLVHPIVDSGLGDVKVVGDLGERPNRSRELLLVFQTLRLGVDVERIVRSDPISTNELLPKPDANRGSLKHGTVQPLLAREAPAVLNLTK